MLKPRMKPVIAAQSNTKIEAIEKTDQEIVSRLREYKRRPASADYADHPTPIEIQTHTGEPVPFLLWGPGFSSNGARRLTEAEARLQLAFMSSQGMIS